MTPSTPLPEQGGFNERLDGILQELVVMKDYAKAKTAIESLMNKERLKGVRDGYSYAYTAVDLATSLSDASKRVYEGHKRAVERCDD